MSVKMNYTFERWIVFPYKTNSPHFIAWVITYKIVELVFKICQTNFKCWEKHCEFNDSNIYSKEQQVCIQH